MRAIRISKTALEQLTALLVQGIAPFGASVVAVKRDLVYDTLNQVLAMYPAIKTPHPQLGLRVYPIERTPFAVLYDFDASEVRVHFIVHRRASLKDLDPQRVEW